MSPTANPRRTTSVGPRPVPELKRAIQRREAARRRRRARFVLLGVTALGLVLAAVWAVYFSQLLAVSSIEVSGTRLLNRDRILAAAQVGEQGSLAAINTTAVERRLAELPEVESVVVTRRWPHTLAIQVQERVGVYVLDRAGSLQLVDRFGVAFHSPSSRPAGLVSARLLNPDERILRDVATVVAALPKPVAAAADHVEADTPDYIRIVLTEGREVVWGSAEQSADKARVLEALLKVAKATTYDVSAPGHPVTRN